MRAGRGQGHCRVLLSPKLVLGMQASRLQLSQALGHWGWSLWGSNTPLAQLLPSAPAKGCGVFVAIIDLAGVI